MEELIKIAFSSINMRVDCVEKEIKNIYNLIEKLSKEVNEQKLLISDIVMKIDGNENMLKEQIREVEEYKFGE